MTAEHPTEPTVDDGSHPFDLPDPTADELRMLADEMHGYLVGTVRDRWVDQLRRIADRIDGTP